MDRKHTGAASSAIFLVGGVFVAVSILVVYALSSGGELEKLEALLHRSTAEDVDPVERLKQDNRMILLVRRIEPLDTEEKVNAVLDILLLIDAPEANAPRFAREALLKRGGTALPVLRARLEADDDPAKLEPLIAEIEESLAEQPEPADAEDADFQDEAEDAVEDDEESAAWNEDVDE